MDVAIKRRQTLVNVVTCAPFFHFRPIFRAYTYSFTQSGTRYGKKSRSDYGLQE